MIIGAEYSLINEEYRQAYLDSIKEFIKAEKQQKSKVKSFCNNQRNRYYEKIVGYPLTLGVESTRIINKELLFSHKNSNIYRISFQIGEILRFFGLLSVPVKQGQFSLCIVSHGGGGVAENVFGIVIEDDDNYNSFGQKIAQEDVVVFAPQFLLWNKENYGTNFERQERLDFDERLKVIGGSITALELYCLFNAIEKIKEVDYVDQDNIGMAGMSYGGMYALFSTLLNDSIKCCYSSSWFNNRSKYSWKDWTYSSPILDHQLVSAIYPKKVYIEVGQKDQMFDIESAKEEYDKLEKLNKKLNQNNYCYFNDYDGIHKINDNFEVISKFLNCIKN